MLDYEKIKRKYILDNMNKVKKEYINPDFKIKINNYCEKYFLDKKSVIKKIINEDKITISIFAKDPSKQNFYEKTAVEYIKQINGVIEFSNLPNGGQNSLYVDKDNIRKKSAYNGELPSKSIDFKWKFKINKIQYYAFHKYIKDNGGAQDNQYNDVLKSIKSAQSLETKAKHKVLFICDGKYFTNKKMQILKNGIININHKVLNIDELEEYLNEKTKKQPKHSKKFEELLNKVANVKTNKKKDK